MRLRIRNRSLIEYLLPAVVLAILLAYSYARFFAISYIGFQFSGNSGEVTEVYVQSNEADTLLPGDVLTAVGEQSWEEIHDGFQANPLAELKPGEHVLLTVQRGESRLKVIWIASGFNTAEFLTRLINTWPPGYAFWLAGTAALLLVRPRDGRLALLVAFNYVTAIWYTAGGLSSWGVLGSSFMLRAGIWLSLPIYLHFHWYFPRRIRPLPQLIWILAYAGSTGLVIAQGFNLIGRDEYFFAFLLAVTGSVIILIFRYLLRREERREIALLFFATAIAFAPALAVAFNSGDASINPALPGLLFSLIALPGAYFYVVYRNQLGGLELRANRLISAYLFAVLLITLALVALPLISTSVEGLEAAGFAVVLTALITTLVTSLGFPSFQRFVERFLLRIPRTTETLASTFAGSLSTSITEQNLAQVLHQEVLPSLLIRQSALIATTTGNPGISIIQLEGVSASDLPSLHALQSWELNASARSEQPTWIHLLIPLEIAGTIHGYWLLGKKDPDDFYHQNELAFLNSLADQMAIALVNIDQARSLRVLHQVDIERQEAERIHLARELHDDVLPRLNALNEKSERSPSKIDELISLIRRMMAGLRPPLLDQGLYLALEQLVEDLNSKYHGVKVKLDVSSNLARYDAAAEQHLFRIIQQACENAIQHGKPKSVKISGTITHAGVDLAVADDGSGFEIHKTGLADLLRTRHYGLAGMSERVAMIGAQLNIDSGIGKGTKIHLSWKRP
jgi:signal transduction histidine kinase